MSKISVNVDKLRPYFPGMPKHFEGKGDVAIDKQPDYRFFGGLTVKPLAEYGELRQRLESKEIKPWEISQKAGGEIEEFYAMLWKHNFDYSDFYNMAYVRDFYFGAGAKSEKPEVQISRDYLALREWVETLYAPREIEMPDGTIGKGNRLMHDVNKHFVFELKARAYPYKGISLDGFGGAKAIPINEKSEVWSEKLESTDVKHKFIGRMYELLEEIEQEYGNEEEHQKRVADARGYRGKGASDAENELLLGLANYTDKYHPQLTDKELFYGRFMACCNTHIPSGKKKGDIARSINTGEVKADDVYNVYDEDLYLYPDGFKRAIRERLRRSGYTRKK